MRPPSLTATILRRLSRGPASAQSLARWCEISIHLMRRLLDAMVREGTIRCVAGRYALPVNELSPAARITLGRGARWHMPVWDVIDLRSAA